MSEQPFYLGFYRSLVAQASTTDAGKVCLVRFILVSLLSLEAGCCGFRQILNANPLSWIFQRYGGYSVG